MKDLTVKFLESEKDVLRLKEGEVIQVVRLDTEPTALRVRFPVDGEIDVNEVNFLYYGRFDEIVQDRIPLNLKLWYHGTRPNLLEKPIVKDGALYLPGETLSKTYSLDNSREYQERKTVLDKAFGRRR